MSQQDLSGYDCTYCGMNASCLDHVVPWSYENHGRRPAQRVTNRKDCVPACQECNGLLSNFMYITIAERALYLSGRLQVKHSKLLKAPDWEPEEYEELSGRLKKQVKSLQTKKKVTQARVAYAKTVAEMSDFTIEAVWESQNSSLASFIKR